MLFNVLQPQQQALQAQQVQQALQALQVQRQQQVRQRPPRHYRFSYLR